MHKHGRVDLNQNEVVEALRRVGCTVQSLSDVGCGCPDLLVGFRGDWYVMEVKTSMGRLTDAEMTWINRAAGNVALVRSANDALRVIGAI